MVAIDGIPCRNLEGKTRTSGLDIINAFWFLRNNRRPCRDAHIVAEHEKSVVAAAMLKDFTEMIKEEREVQNEVKNTDASKCSNALSCLTSKPVMVSQHMEINITSRNMGKNRR